MKIYFIPLYTGKNIHHIHVCVYVHIRDINMFTNMHFVVFDKIHKN